MPESPSHGSASKTGDPEPSGDSTSPAGGRTTTPTQGGPTGPAPPWSEAEWRRARRIVAGLSLAEKAGQVIVAGFEGTTPPRELVDRYHVGGVIVMGWNVSSPGQVRDLIRGLQDEAREQGRTWPLVVGVDQEGGRVARIRSPLTEFPSYMTLGAARDPKLTRSVARASGTELRELGFTMVFAPVADVTIGPSDPTIGSRSASSDPRLVASTVEASIRGYADAGIVPVVKHFPGHGSVTSDSHVSLPVQEADLERLQRRDLVPFRSAVSAGTPAVMTAHIDTRAIDPGVPATVSKKVIDGVLRKRLSFSGVVVTDALNMAGVAEKYGSAGAGVRALRAGADLLLLPADVGALHAAIVQAVRTNELTQDRLDEAATRSVALMLHVAARRARLGNESRDSAQVSYAASLRGLTVVSGPCRGRLVGSKVQVIGGDEADRERFAHAARSAGLEVVRRASADEGPRSGAGDVVRLVRSSGGTGDVVVALDTPYALGASEATKARIALYGSTPGAFRALVDVLTGKEVGRGRLPVDVDGFPADSGCPRSP
ncbi:MAG TPA: glycoside hydrolase family 3 protein [Actinopolymorphaceae bacterium]|jgi:beta-N-acetylhexosaminidase